MIWNGTLARKDEEAGVDDMTTILEDEQTYYDVVPLNLYENSTM